MKYAMQNCVTEWSYSSGKSYGDPFNELQLDVTFTDPNGVEHVVPAFWAGEQTWRVRYSSPTLGRHRCRSLCSDPTNRDMHGREDVVEVTPYTGDHPLYRHGPLQANAEGRYLEHLDGTPFFWLGDTWWMGLCKRLSWPGDFQTLVADRVAKGFNVIQIVAGLYPDMPPFDERGANEAGFPWEPNYARINPAYFDMADLRIHRLVEAGLVPCIVACWGYFIHWLGVERMQTHWRYLVARYGAYPVIWCLAGEVLMPYYVEQPGTPEAVASLEDKTERAWTQVGTYLRAVDPYHRLLTVHPGSRRAGRLALDDSFSDVDMHQSGHAPAQALHVALERSSLLIERSRARTPAKPIVEGEVCYEGIFEANRQETQRLMFWTRILSGAMGHTYGANGIWQVNVQERPFGPSPHGMSWGNTPWNEAARLPGAAQLGMAKRLLTRYNWWRFEPHPEWILPHWTPEDRFQPYAAGIPRQVRICYLPCGWPQGITIASLEVDVSYRAYLWNPVNGSEIALGAVMAGSDGRWVLPSQRFPILQDWVLVLDTEEM